eukprot:COSAG01_NODE_2598_length_7399_cov_4.972740_2_plen_1464_part_00
MACPRRRRKAAAHSSIVPVPRQAPLLEGAAAGSPGSTPHACCSLPVLLPLLLLPLLCGGGGGAAAAAGGGPLLSDILPQNLTVEYHRAPIIDCQPRFSWKPVASAVGARNVSQASYRLQLFNWSWTGNTLVWDSGRVLSRRTLHVELPRSVALAADSAFRWRVQLWSSTAGGPSAWSANASFGTALLDQTNDWLAPWIVSDWPQQQLRLRVNLAPGKLVARARVYAASGGYSVIFANGVNINAAYNEELGPWTSWSERILYKAFDVTGSLRHGAQNAVGVWLGRGQYGKYAHVYDGWRNNTWNASNSGQPGSRILSTLPAVQNKSGKLFNNRASVPGGLRLQLNVHYSDGSRQVFGAGGLDGWQASHGPVGWNDPGGMGCAAGEDVDLTRPAWSAATNWSSSSVHLLSAAAPPQRAKLSVDASAPIRAHEERWPVRLEGDRGSWTFWFAENYVGRSVLHGLNLPRGTRITLQYSMQMVCPNQTVALVGCINGSLFHPEGQEMTGLDTFVLAGTPNETATTHFVYHGYQFVALQGWPQNATPPTLRSLSGVVTHSDNRKIAHLTFPRTREGQLLRKIDEAMTRTLLSNHFSVETDGLSERNGWTGDSQATCESAVRTLDMAAFYSKWMLDIQDAQNCAGMKRTPGCGPGSLSPTCPYTKHDPPYDPTWVSNYAQEVALLHKYYGDKRVVETHYDSLKAYVEYARNVKVCPGCWAESRANTQAADPPHLPHYGWSADWMQWRDLQVCVLSSGAISSSMHFILDLETLLHFATILGRTQDIQYYGDLSTKYRAQFNRLYLGPHNATHHRSQRQSTDAAAARLLTPRSYCVPCELQSGAHSQSCTCKTQAQQIIPLYSSSAPVGRMPPLVPADAQGEVVSTLLEAIRCPANPTYAECPLNLDPALEHTSWAGGLNFSHANATAWSKCWQQPPTCNRSAPGRINTGLVTTSKILPVLTRYNHSELALQLAISTELPSWGYIVAHNGTTMWEGWSGKPYSTGTRSCHNQHQDAGGAQWFHDSLVGLQAGQQGTAFSQVVVAPAITHSPALPSMSGEYETPRGRFVVSWSRARDLTGFALNVTAPVNVHVTSRLPTLGRTDVTLTESGTVLWPAAPDREPAVAGVAVVRVAVDTIDVEHGSGSYSFVLKSDDTSTSSEPEAQLPAHVASRRIKSAYDVGPPPPPHPGDTACGTPPAPLATDGRKNALIIGDSISMGYGCFASKGCPPKPQPSDRSWPDGRLGYGLYVQELLAANFSVQHSGGWYLGGQAGDTSGTNTSGNLKVDACDGCGGAMRCLRSWLGPNVTTGGYLPWDVIAVNFGLHDLGGRGPRREVPLSNYSENLREIFEMMQPTGADIVWTSTTPVPANYPPGSRTEADVVRYNAAAAAVAAAYCVSVNDLHGTVVGACPPSYPKDGNCSELQWPKGVHFVHAGRQLCAQSVASSIIKAAARKERRDQLANDDGTNDTGRVC